MTRIERIDAEIAVLREKETGIQARIRALQAQKADAENAQIVQTVRKLRLTPAQLADFLDKHKNTLTNPTRPPVTADAVSQVPAVQRTAKPKKESEETPNETNPA